MNGQPVSVSSVEEIRRSLLVTGFGYEHDEPWAANMQLFKVGQGVDLAVWCVCLCALHALYGRLKRHSHMS